MVSIYSYILFIKHLITGRNVIIAGGYLKGNEYDDILEYDPDEDSMVRVGNMIQPRYYHAVSVVQTQDYARWCR